jgi:hypothetical protein
MSVPAGKNRHVVQNTTAFYSISRSKLGKIETHKDPIETLTTSSPTLSQEYDIHVKIANYGTKQQMYSVKTIRGESNFVPLSSVKAALINTGFAFNTELPMISKIEFLETPPEQLDKVTKYFSEKHKLELILSKH